jgi:hypothetical protein
MISNFLPIASMSGNPVIDLMPTGGQIPTQLAYNRDTFGGPIRPVDTPYNSDQPDSQKSFSTLPSVYQNIAEGMNFLGGGDKYRPAKFGALDTSGENLQHIGEQFTGGAGVFVRRLLQTIANAMAGDIKFNDVPLLRLFFNEVPEYAKSRSAEYVKKAEDSVKRYNRMVSENPEEAAKYLDEDGMWIEIGKNVLPKIDQELEVIMTDMEQAATAGDKEAVKNLKDSALKVRQGFVRTVVDMFDSK